MRSTFDFLILLHCEYLIDLCNYICNYRGGNLSESEAELDTAENRIIVPEDDLNSKGCINLKNTSSAIRLTEMGPRLKLKLMKIQEGVCDGEVLYHSYMHKTPEEILKIRENLKNKLVFND